MNDKLIQTAIQTIQLEAESIAGLAAFINNDFSSALEAIYNTSGRLVISGVGKSAIVAQKIVATLNSTGTQSLFMHAADAIHGDLGMIRQDDVVMLISKSGETAEIKLLVPVIKNFGNLLVGLCGNENSYLAQHCNFFLNTTVRKEACPNNLAPTSSTTAQMVMGDALAICLMEMRGFTGNDFAKFHPGGNLGKRLFLRVRDLYTYNNKPAVRPAASLREIIVEISKGRLGATAVTDDKNKVLGVITDGDLRRMMESETSPAGLTAEAIFHRNPRTILPDELAVNALDVLRVNDISQLIVVDEANTYLGMLHLHDIVKEGIV